MSKLSKAARLAIGLLLLPTAFFVFLGFVDILFSLAKGYKVTLYFLLGFSIYPFIHKFVYGFSRVYVLSHEFTHAMAALCCGHRVKSVSVGEDSGNVKLSGVNTFILLAPYIIPLFAILVIAAYFITGLFVGNPDKRIFLALFGFFVAMHLTHTFKSLTEAEQTDIKEAGGSVFSFSLIVVLNAAVILILLELFLPGVVPIGGVIFGVIKNTILFWKNFFKYIYNFAVWAATR
jgi:hypothetical protein